VWGGARLVGSSTVEWWVAVSLVSLMVQFIDNMLPQSAATGVGCCCCAPCLCSKEGDTTAIQKQDHHPRSR
jgi:hypothetical protein